jgi:hypothetical protein
VSHGSGFCFGRKLGARIFQQAACTLYEDSKNNAANVLRLKNGSHYKAMSYGSWDDNHKTFKKDAELNYLGRYALFLPTRKPMSKVLICAHECVQFT